MNTKPQRIEADPPLLASAIEQLRENFHAFHSRRKYGKVGVVIDMEAGTPVLVREQCEGLTKPNR
jgi:hypothetical protein